MTRKKTLFILPILLLGFLIWLPAAHAQTPTQVIIIYPAAEPQADSMALNVFFTLIDENGQPIPNPNVDSAEIQLVGGNTSPVEASVEDPKTPFYIALLLDASGSMANAMPAVHEAAQTALQNAPSTARFGVFQFNELDIDEPLRPIENFTSDLVLVGGGINAVQAEPNAPTCLYNALYQTIELLDEATQKPQERQAILLFTDGKDERADGTPCSQRTYQDVINRAIRDAPITPIHAVGLCSDAACSNIKREELRNMAKETFAFSALGAKDQLGNLFQQIMQGLSSQLVARANVYPHQGDNDAILRVKLRDEGTLTASFKFFSDRDYAAPLAPVAIQMIGPRYDKTKDIFQFSLSVTSFEALQRIVLQAWDSKLGLISEQQYNPAPAQEIEFKPQGFEVGHEYSFRVLAIDKQGQGIPGKEGKPYLVESDTVTYNPNQSTSINFSIESVTPDYAANKLIINLTDIPDEGRITKYEGFIIEAETSNHVADFEPELYQNRQIEVDLPGPIKQIQGNTKYRVTIKLTTKDDQVSEAITEFTAVPPAAPGFFQSIWLALSNNPVITFSIIIIGLIVTIVVIYWNRPAKKEGLPSPLPRPPIDQTMISITGSSVDAPQPQPQPKPQPPRPAPRLRLKVLQSPSPPATKEKMITTFPFAIGRDGCDFNIPDQRITRRHLEISVQNGKFFVTDLESRNGTFMGDHKLTPHQPAPILGLTTIKLGQQTQVELEPMP
jgi:hypothetical protein